MTPFDLDGTGFDFAKRIANLRNISCELWKNGGDLEQSRSDL
jgi:hypothetical protein